MGPEFYPFLSGGGGVIISHPLMKRLYDGNFLSRDICILWEKLCLKYGQSLSYACDATLAYVLHKFFPSHRRIEDDRFKACSMYNRGKGDIDVCACSTSYNWDKLIVVHYMESPAIRDFHSYIIDEPITTDNKWTLVTDWHGLTDSFLLSLPFNLVIYCEEEQHLDRDPNITKMVVKTGQKLDLLMEAAREDYFHSEFYAWIDSDIALKTGPAKHQLYRALQQYREKISFSFLTIPLKLFSQVLSLVLERIF